jgi:hypothetical protein
VFQALADSLPFGSGVIGHRGELDLAAEWRKLADAELALGGSSVYLDYWNGIGFKMSLPAALETTEDAQLAAMGVGYGRYDDRNATPFATRLGQLMRTGSVGARTHASTPVNKLLGVAHTAVVWQKDAEAEAKTGL